MLICLLFETSIQLMVLGSHFNKQKFTLSIGLRYQIISIKNTVRKLSDHHIMATYINSAKHFFEAYKKWVAENPQTVTDVETTAKWVSYFVAGRISNSSVVTEMIYSLSNLLVLFNDRIIEKSRGITDTVGEKFAYRLKVILTTLEYCEVFLETSARKIFGEKGKWFLIVVVQTIKMIGRYFLLRQYSECIIRSPPIQLLNRKAIGTDNNVNQNNKDLQNGANREYFKLARSKIVIRNVECAPPLHYRNWKPLKEERSSKTNISVLLKAEALYVAKPLIHLISMGVFGRKSWRSYSIALILDIASIRMYYKHQHLMTKEQKVELSRRCVSLLLFLVRSPFYDNISKHRIERIVESLGNKIPFANAISKPLIEYIPQWQNTYFYMWST